MKCRKIRSWMPLYVSGDLASDEVVQVDLHVSACDDCRGEVEAFQKSRLLLGLLADVPAVSASSSAAAGNPWLAVRARLREAPGHKPLRPGRGRSWVRALAWAAIFLLGLGTGLAVSPWASLGLSQGEGRGTSPVVRGDGTLPQGGRPDSSFGGMPVSGSDHRRPHRVMSGPGDLRF